MSIEHFKVILDQGLPVKVSRTAHVVHMVILWRYDVRKTLENGTPNPGYGKSYPGMEELMRATQVSRQSVEKALSELIEKNIIDQVTLAKHGTQAEFRPICAMGLLGERVNLALHVYRNTVSSRRRKSVAPAMQASKARENTVSRSLDTISTTSTHKYDKYKRKEINHKRWNEILSYIKDDVKMYLDPGSNYESRLDKLERQGTSPQAIGTFMARQNWSTSYSIGGLFESLLDQLLGVKKASESSSMPPHCGECDPATRQFLELSTGHDGKETYECLTCHPNQVRLRRRLSEPHKSNVLELPSKGKEFPESPISIDFDTGFRSVNEQLEHNLKSVSLDLPRSFHPTSLHKPH